MVQPNETNRLAVLNALNVLDTPRENQFDRLVFVLAQMFRAPMAVMTLIDKDRQWFKARIGIHEPEFSRRQSICSHTIQSADLLVVEDTSADGRFHDSPMVLGTPFIRFYAGASLVGPGGFRVGTMCVFDRIPRLATAAQLRVLAQVTEEASGLLAARIVEDGTAPNWLGYTGDT